MVWFLAFAFLFFLFRRASRAGDRLAECEPTGMLRSPLFHTQTALLVALLGLMFAPSCLPHERWMAVAYFIALGLVVTALLLVRRALKWRYPI
jgi:hypothetical protein